MAVTDIHPILNFRNSLRNSIAYILNEEKTDEKLLVSTSNCSVDNILLEFELAKSLNKFKQKEKAYEGYHLIQSFSPEDNVTPEEANRIGYELAKKLYGDNFQFIVSTHIDKGHIHNHIISNAYHMEGKAKFQSNINVYEDVIKKESDKLCREHGLSVIEQTKAPEEIKNPKTKKKIYKNKSHKSILKEIIEETIPLSKDYEDFLQRIQDQGYEIKRDKEIKEGDNFRTEENLAFKNSKQKNFTWIKSMDYSLEEIKERIANNKNLTALDLDQDNDGIIDRLDADFRNPDVETLGDLNKNLSENKSFNDDNKNEKTSDKKIAYIMLTTKIDKYVKPVSSKGKAYKIWSEKHNLDVSISILNFLRENNLTSIEQLVGFENDYLVKENNNKNEIASNNKKIKENIQAINSMKKCVQRKNIFRNYNRLKGEDKKEFYEENKIDIEIYKENNEFLKSIYKDRIFPTINELNLEKDELINKNNLIYQEQNEIKNLKKEMNTIKKNIAEIYNENHQEETREKKKSVQRKTSERVDR